MQLLVLVTMVCRAVVILMSLNSSYATESSLLISMFASFVPAATLNISSQNSTEMNLSLSVPPPSFEEPEITSNWDSWKDENIIEICEVNISVDGYLLCECIKDFLL